MKKNILIAALILIVAGFAVLKANLQPLAGGGLSSSLPLIPAGSPKFDDNPQHYSSAPASPALSSSEKTAQPDNGTKTPADMKVYKNNDYGIELSYPSAFGDVIAQPDEFIALPVSDKGPDECKDQGQFLHKGFSRNSSIDFGVISIHYKKCSIQKHSIFDANKVSVSGNDLTLAFWNANSVNMAIEKIIPLPNSNGINGYIIKNFIGDARGEAAAVVPTPSNNLGPLIFRISNKNTPNVLSYDQGAQLLEQLISQ